MKVKCQFCGDSFDEDAEDAELIGWYGVCSKCLIGDEIVEVCDD